MSMRLSLAQHLGVLSMQSVSSEASKAAILVDHLRTAEVGHKRPAKSHSA
jgi:hypothetical protein